LFRTGGLEASDVDITGQPMLFSAIRVSIFTLGDEPDAKGDAVKIGKDGIHNRSHLWELYFGPIIAPRAFESPRATGGRFAERGQVNVNDFAILKARERPEPQVIVGGILKERAKAGPVADQGIRVLQIGLVMDHGGVSGLKQARNSARGRVVIIDMAVTE